MVSSERLMPSVPSTPPMAEKNASRFAELMEDLFVSYRATCVHQTPVGFASAAGGAPVASLGTDCWGRAGLRNGLPRNAGGMGPPVAQASNSTVWTTGAWAKRPI